jgi:hypothetical protein
MAGEQAVAELANVLPLDDAATISDRGGSRTHVIRFEVSVTCATGQIA